MLKADRQKNVYSEQEKEEDELKKFMDYMVKSGVALSVIKYMIHLRSCDSFPENPLNILNNHFAAESNEKMKFYKSMISEYQVLKEENDLLLTEKTQLQEQLASSSINNSSKMPSDPVVNENQEVTT